MATIIPLAIVALVLVLLVMMLLKSKKGQSAQCSKPKGNIYRDLRDKPFSLKPEEIGITSEDSKTPFGALMEFAYPEVTISVVAFSDGNASMYFSSGGAAIGGYAHESIVEAAKAFVASTKKFLPQMQLTTDFSLPKPGEVFFYVLTESGVYRANAIESELEQKKTPLWELYFGAHAIISAYREISGG